MALTGSQSQVAAILLGECRRLNAPSVCWRAIIYAGLFESNLGDNSDTYTPNSSGYWGVLQGSTGNWPDPHDVKGQADSFLQGGRGFNSALTFAQQGMTDPIEMAVRVEVPSIWPDNAYAHESGYPGDVAALAEVDSIVAANGGATPKAGGVAGMGGTGSSTGPTFQPFTVEANEDYWTASNRLAQQAQVYLFSNGETVYLMDAASMLAQQQDAIIDRWVDPDTGKIRTNTDFRSGYLGADVIQRLSITYDNTTFQWSSTHKHRGKVQKKSALTKVQSPTEVQMDVICPIDYFAAGEAVGLRGCGPANGVWIIADCTRSVFQVFSSLILVPGMAPLPEYEVAGAGTTSSTTGAGTGSGTPTGSTAGLVSPFTKKYTAGLSNTDQGVDFGTQQGIATGDPILAIGDCYCRSTQDFYVGSINPQALWFELVDKSAGYWGWYVAEQIDEKVGASGTLIKAGTIVATFASAGTGIEIGWAAGPGQTATAAFHPGEVASRHDGNGTTDGRNFLGFLQKVGAI